jgi:ABC-type sulfate transport system permease subunit
VYVRVTKFVYGLYFPRNSLLQLRFFVSPIIMYDLLLLLLGNSTVLICSASAVAIFIFFFLRFLLRPGESISRESANE